MTVSRSGMTVASSKVNDENSAGPGAPGPVINGTFGVGVVKRAKRIEPATENNELGLLLDVGLGLGLGNELLADLSTAGHGNLDMSCAVVVPPFAQCPPPFEKFFALAFVVQPQGPTQSAAQVISKHLGFVSPAAGPAAAARAAAESQTIPVVLSRRTMVVAAAGGCFRAASKG